MHFRHCSQSLQDAFPEVSPAFTSRTGPDRAHGQVSDLTWIALVQIVGKAYNQSAVSALQA